MTEPRKGFSPTVLWLSVGFCFLFAGASQQQFQSPYFDQALGWPPVRRSLILAVVYLSFGFWRLRIGSFIRAWGEKPVLILGSASYGLFCLAVYLTTSYPLLLLAAALWGWGAAANWGASTQMVLAASHDQRYGSNSGLFMGLTKIGFAAGILLLATVFNTGTAAAGPAGARLVWLWAAGLSALGVLVLFRVPDQRTAIDPPSLADQWAIMRSTKGAITSFFLFLGGVGFGSMLGAIADQLAQALAHGETLYVAVFFALAAFLVNVVGGPLSDRFGRPRTLQVVFLLAAGGLFGAWAAPESIAALAVCALFLGLQAGLVPTLAMAMIGEAASASRRQNAYGALFFWRDMGVAGALLVTQKLHQAKDLRTALLALAVVTLGCAALSVVLGRRVEEQL